MSEFEMFCMDHPWALDLVKSDIIMRFLVFVSTERTIKEIKEAFSYVEENLLKRMIEDMKALGLVKGDETLKLTNLGEKFISVCKSALES